MIEHDKKYPLSCICFKCVEKAEAKKASQPYSERERIRFWGRKKWKEIKETLRKRLENDPRLN